MIKTTTAATTTATTTTTTTTNFGAGCKFDVDTNTAALWDMTIWLCSLVDWIITLQGQLAAWGVQNRSHHAQTCLFRTVASRRHGVTV